MDEFPSQPVRVYDAVEARIVPNRADWEEFPCPLLEEWNPVTHNRERERLPLARLTFGTVRSLATGESRRWWGELRKVDRSVSPMLMLLEVK